MIGAAFVVEQVCRPCVGGKEDVWEAIIVDVTIRRRSRDFWSGEYLAHLRGNFGELSSAQVPKQMRRLGIADTLLHALDFVFNVAVGNEDIRPAVVVVVEEEAAKAESDQSVTADL